MPETCFVFCINLVEIVMFTFLISQRINSNLHIPFRSSATERELSGCPAIPISGVWALPQTRGTRAFPLIRGVRSFPLIWGLRSFPIIRGARTFPIIRGAWTFPIIRGVRTFLSAFRQRINISRPARLCDLLGFLCFVMLAPDVQGSSRMLNLIK